MAQDIYVCKVKDVKNCEAHDWIIQKKYFILFEIQLAHGTIRLHQTSDGGVELKKFFPQ